MSLEQFVSEVNSGIFSNLTDKFWTLYEPQAYDVEKLVATLMELKSRKSYNNNDFNYMIAECLQLYARVGNLSTNNRKRFSDAAKEASGKLISNLGLVIVGGNLSPTAITIPRIAGVWATQAHQICMRIGPKRFQSGSFESQLLSEFWNFGELPSIFPTYTVSRTTDNKGKPIDKRTNLPEGVKEVILAAGTMYSGDLSELLEKSKGNQVTDLKLIWNNQLKIMENKYRSKYPTVTTRRNYIAKREKQEISLADIETIIIKARSYDYCLRSDAGIVYDFLTALMKRTDSESGSVRGPN